MEMVMVMVMELEMVMVLVMVMVLRHGGEDFRSRGHQKTWHDGPNGSPVPVGSVNPFVNMS